MRVSSHRFRLRIIVRRRFDYTPPSAKLIEVSDSPHLRPLEQTQEKPVSVDYYLARAADARADADAAILANVREQCLRCEAVWNDMAARVAETEAMRRRNKAPSEREVD